MISAKTEDKLKSEKLYPKLISGLIEKFQLSLASIKSNKNGALYKVKFENNHEYFDYFTNLMFYQFCHFFNLDEKYIPKEDLSNINYIFMDIFNKHNIDYLGRENNSFYFFSFLMFFNQTNKILSEFYFNILNDFLESKVYVHITQPTSHDIVILSTFYNSILYKDKDNIFAKFRHLEKWFLNLQTKLEIK